MFGFFASQNRKMRTNARNWIEAAETVWNYRRDLLAEADARELRARTEELRQKLKAKADAADLKLGIDALEPVLTRNGGKIFPKTGMIDNVEFVLVVALCILSFRAFIAQPFKIPTNSMKPSYYGMTADNLLAKGQNPNLVERAARFVFRGAFRQEMLAPTTGEVSMKVLPYGNYTLAYTVVGGRKWLVIPTQLKEYTFYVDGAETKIRVPLDFNEFDEMVHETFFGSTANFQKAFVAAGRAKQLEPANVRENDKSAKEYPVALFHTGRRLKAGEPVLRFDILTGDMLFVDRLSYHFVRPSVGDGFVFRTRQIPGIGEDQYYIKRLVGTPGDKLEIIEPNIYRNDAPISGSPAFGKNVRREGLYRGYFDGTTINTAYLRRGETLKVPEKSFFAMGDNSGNSRDSRFWGFIPAKEVLGRPIFIFFPFTNRWGFSN